MLGSINCSTSSGDEAINYAKVLIKNNYIKGGSSIYTTLRVINTSSHYRTMVTVGISVILTIMWYQSSLVHQHSIILTVGVMRVGFAFRTTFLRMPPVVF